MARTLGVDAGEVSEQIIHRVADREDADPVELPPLFDAIDPDALDAIFAPTAAGEIRAGEVTFPYAGHEITVHFDGGPVVTIE